MHKKMLVVILPAVVAGMMLSMSSQTFAQGGKDKGDKGDGGRGQGGLVVDDDRRQCRNANFTSIQEAVNAATPGMTISVCAGTYTEQITIPDSKDGITLRGSTGTIVKAPAVMLEPKAIIHVDGADDVTIERLTITGPGGGACDSLRSGVLVDDEGSATISDNRITQIRDQPLSNCQDGDAVQIGSFINGSSSPGVATIVRNQIDGYQKNGVTVNEEGSFADVLDNNVTGSGPTNVSAQNGIQVGFGAVAAVSRNNVSRNLFTGDTFSATGILLFQPGSNVTVERNEVAQNDSGISTFGATMPLIRRNRVSRNTLDGIDLTGGTTRSVVSRNDSLDNDNDGLFVDEGSTQNTISRNKSFRNGNFDAEDLSSGNGTAGTANFWENNRCDTSNPTGLCEGGRGGRGPRGPHGRRPHQPRR